MNSTQLNLETVTPMFLHGYDNRILELRPPPFKALFRYWWRTVQDCEENTLRQAEAELFGSTDGKAPFSVRIPGTTNLGNPKKYSPLPHKGGSKMEAYDVGKPFNLCLITKNASEASSYKKIAKLSFLLGGIGNRSRRGFGSICETCWKFTDICDLRKAVLDTLNEIWNTCNAIAAVQKKRFRINDFCINNHTIEIIKSEWCDHYPPKYPVIRRVFFGKPTNNLDGLLKQIGQATHKAKLKNSDDTLGAGTPRMASPIVIRIQMVGGQYIPVVTQLSSCYPKYTQRNIRRQPSNIRQKQTQFIDDIIT